MSFLDLFRAKTIASYRPEQVKKGEERLLDGARLVKLLATSLEKMTIPDLLGHEGTLKAVLSSLASDIFLRKLADADLAAMNHCIPSLVAMHRLAPVPVQIEISEILHHLGNPAAAPFMLEKIRDLAARKEVFLDRDEVHVLSSTVRFFIRVPDPMALDPLLSIYRRAKNLYMESSLAVDPQNFRIWSLQALCEIGKKDQAPKLIEFLQKIEKSQSPDRGLAKEILVAIEAAQIAAAVTGNEH